MVESCKHRFLCWVEGTNREEKCYTEWNRYRKTEESTGRNCNKKMRREGNKEHEDKWLMGDCGSENLIIKKLDNEFKQHVKCLSSPWCRSPSLSLGCPTIDPEVYLLLRLYTAQCDGMWNLTFSTITFLTAQLDIYKWNMITVSTTNKCSKHRIFHVG